MDSLSVKHLIGLQEEIWGADKTGKSHVIQITNLPFFDGTLNYVADVYLSAAPFFEGHCIE